MEVLLVNLMYLCHVLHKLSKHFLIITFDGACDVLKYHTSIICSCIVYSFQSLTKRRDCSFKPTKTILRPTASPLITREDNLQVPSNDNNSLSWTLELLRFNVDPNNSNC